MPEQTGVGKRPPSRLGLRRFIRGSFIGWRRALGLVACVQKLDYIVGLQ
jgi:hypothetical protein